MLVTSRTNSYIAWRQWIDANFAQVTVISPKITFLEHSSYRGVVNTTHRIVDGDRLEINMHAFPLDFRKHGKLHSTILQFWQFWRCHEMMLESERALGGTYTRVARVRSDVLLSTLLWPAGTNRVALADWALVVEAPDSDVESSGFPVDTQSIHRHNSLSSSFCIDAKPAHWKVPCKDKKSLCNLEQVAKNCRRTCGLCSEAMGVAMNGSSAHSNASRNAWIMTANRGCCVEGRCAAAACTPAGHLTTDAAYVAQLQRRVIAQCSARAARGPGWLVHSEFFSVGSRAAVLAALRAFDLLRSVRYRADLRDPMYATATSPLALCAAARCPRVRACYARNRSHVSLEVLWAALLALDRSTPGLLRDPHREPLPAFNSYYTQGAFSVQPECLAALGDMELIRAFGAPLNVYYFQSSETLCENGTEHAECARLLHERWHLAAPDAALLSYRNRTTAPEACRGVLQLVRASAASHSGAPGIGDSDRSLHGWDWVFHPSEAANASWDGFQEPSPVGISEDVCFLDF